MTDEKKENKKEKLRKPLPRKKELKNTQSMDDLSGGHGTPQGTANNQYGDPTIFACSDNC